MREEIRVQVTNNIKEWRARFVTGSNFVVQNELERNILPLLELRRLGDPRGADFDETEVHTHTRCFRPSSL